MYDGNSVVYRNQRIYVSPSLTVYCYILSDIIAVFLILTRATSQLKAVLKFVEEKQKKLENGRRFNARPASQSH